MDFDSPSFLRRLVYGVVFGIVVYAVFILVGDAGQLFEQLRQVPLFVIAVACGLSLLNYAIRFLRWHLYLRLLDLSVPLGRSIVVFLAGLLMAISPGKIGEILKSALLKRSNELPVARTVPIVFAERLTDLFGLFVLAAVGIVVFEYGVVGFAIGLALLIGFVVVLQFPPAVHLGLDILEKLPFVRSLRDRLDDAYAATRTLIAWRPLGVSTVLGALAWSMEALAFAWILVHLGASSPVVLEAFFVYSVSTLAGAVTLLPGGLGVTEGSMTGLLMWVELFDDTTPAAAATIVIRFTTLWFGVIVGILSFLLYEWNQDRRVPRRTPGEGSANDEDENDL